MSKKPKSKPYGVRLSKENEEYVLIKSLREERTKSDIIDRIITKMRKLQED